MTWELKQVGKTDWRQDDSGYYTLIHYIENGTVRIDFMDKDDMPVISFQGLTDDVRKCSVRLMAGFGGFSHEHASYIGAELARCAIQGTEYIQD